MKDELLEKDNNKKIDRVNRKSSLKVLKVVVISTSIPSLFLGILYLFWSLQKSNLITNFQMIIFSGLFLITVIALMVSYVIKK